MAIIYVDSNASAGAQDGTSWADAYLTLAAALTPATPGTDVIWVASDHYESGVSYTPTNAGNGVTITPIISVNSSNDEYTKASAAQFDYTGSLSFNDSFSLHGLNFAAATFYCGNTSLDNCLVEDCYITVSGDINATYAGNRARSGFNNTSANFVLGGFKVGAGVFTWTGGSIIGQMSTTDLFRIAAAEYKDIIFDSVDMGTLTSSSNPNYNLYENTDSYALRAKLFNCILPYWGGIGPYDKTGDFLADNETSGFGSEIIEVNTYFANEYIPWRTVKRNFLGITSATDATYRDDGYSEPSLSTRISMKMFAFPNRANLKHSPLEGLPITAELPGAGTYTITLEAFEDGWTIQPDDSEFWITLSVPNNSNTPAGSFISTQGEVASSGNSLSSSSKTWTTSGSGNTISVSASVTVNRSTTIEVTPFLGKYEAGRSMYYCPKLEIT
jgi:hypothetical protein